MAEALEKQKTKGWNKLAIVSMILWLIPVYFGDKIMILGLFQPVGLVCGVISYRQIKKTNERGMGLCKLAIFLNGLTTLTILFTVLLLASRQTP